MKKKILISLLFFIPICLFADNQKSKSRKTITADRMAEIISKRTGGKLIRPGSLQGCVLIINTQSAAPEKWIRNCVDYLYSATKFQMELKNGKFDFPNVENNGNLTLYIIDNAEFPPILHAPISGWAMVNVASLKHETKPQFFEARVKKHLTRSFALLAGAQNSSFPNSIMGGMTSPLDVDKIPSYKIPVDIMSRFNGYVSEFGIAPAKEVSYKKAVEEGWAPAPTNDIQKAIWDKVHAMPTAPLKIKPETKKVVQ